MPKKDSVMLAKRWHMILRSHNPIIRWSSLNMINHSYDLHDATYMWIHVYDLLVVLDLLHELHVCRFITLLSRFELVFNSFLACFEHVFTSFFATFWTRYNTLLTSFYNVFATFLNTFFTHVLRRYERVFTTFLQRFEHVCDIMKLMK